MTCSKLGGINTRQQRNTRKVLFLLSKRPAPSFQFVSRNCPETIKEDERTPSQCK